jgi:hypothetical protein
MIDDNEIKEHVFEDHPYHLLEKYPGVHQLLEQRVEKTQDLLNWREFETLVQFEGWTCNLCFHWRYSKGQFHIEAVKLFKVCRAPGDQYEV